MAGSFDWHRRLVACNALAASYPSFPRSAQERRSGRSSSNRLPFYLLCATVLLVSNTAPASPQEVIGYEQPFDQQSDARYAEPPPPPFDPNIPTWAPCQSLRTNRSLVLGHLWFGMDIMGWATKGVHTPAIITTSPAGTADTDAGILGLGARTIFGNEIQHNEVRPGGRLTIGWWFDPNQHRGIEWHYFELDGADIRFNPTADNTSGIVARPVIDAQTGDNSAVLSIFPGLLDGTVRVSSDMQLTSTGIIYRNLLWASYTSRFDYLVGYRHAHLFDRLRVREDLTSLDDSSGFDEDTSIMRLDSFRAVNQFDGADFGIKGWWSPNGKIALTSISKLAIGATNRNVIIEGSTATRLGGTRTIVAGGVLAQPPNIGRRSEQDFGVVSEFGLGLEWTPICFWKFSLGYNVFYWSDVARAVSQIDRTVDLSQTCACPGFQMHTTSFWAQGLTAGFSYQF
jgi:hypothetical protein